MELFFEASSSLLLKFVILAVIISFISFSSCLFRFMLLKLPLYFGLIILLIQLLWLTSLTCVHLRLIGGRVLGHWVGEAGRSSVVAFDGGLFVDVGAFGRWWFILGEWGLLVVVVGSFLLLIIIFLIAICLIRLNGFLLYLLICLYWRLSCVTSHSRSVLIMIFYFLWGNCYFSHHLVAAIPGLLRRICAICLSAHHHSDNHAFVVVVTCQFHLFLLQFQVWINLS